MACIRLHPGLERRLPFRVITMNFQLSNVTWRKLTSNNLTMQLNGVKSFLYDLRTKQHLILRRVAIFLKSYFGKMIQVDLQNLVA